jgi:hypothetical protein
MTALFVRGIEAALMSTRRRELMWRKRIEWKSVTGEAL